ncbi:hypothetical protein FIC_00232 [Flavobacteriaceae bacterium 3519-10]|nr:hypothetical protein FIC_00232 [Flavobacteriaceae bacterium 3519-10]
MAKVHPIIKVEGKIGDRIYYTLNGKPVARRIAKKRRGPKTKGEQKKALFASEFGKASAAGRVLREALGEIYTRLNDRYLYQRINKIMALLRSADVSEPGFRTVAGGLATDEGQKLLADFDFHQKAVVFPRILTANTVPGKLQLHFSDDTTKPVTVLELQINFDNRAYRSHEHAFPKGVQAGPVTLKKRFRRKKGFTDLVFISGPGFLQAVGLGGRGKGKG